MHVKFWSVNLNRRDHLENLGVGGRIILKLMLKEKFEDVGWVHLTQKKVR
jgi:hypothetical protein